MDSRDSRSEYQKRMHRVTEHIDRNLDQPLDLATLAEVAHFSPYHFHRLFSAWMGETLGDYLRRRRLEIAAIRLVTQPRTPVLHVALAVGFGSAEAFARAFRARFGCAPTVWRTQTCAANSNPDQVDRKLDQASTAALQDDEGSYRRYLELSMNVRLIERQPVTVAYLRHVGPYGEPVHRFWMQTVYPWLSANHLLDPPCYGVSHDNPGVTAPDQCRYDACVEVPADYIPTGGALKTTLPGGKYASLHFRGGLADIGPAWNSLLGQWLPSSGLQLDHRPCFEVYSKETTYDPTEGMFECDICIPVVPL